VFAALLLLVLEFTLQRGIETVVISPAKANATAVVFASAVCPVSDKYVERLNDLYARFSRRGVQFVVVYPNANESWRDIETYSKRNGLTFPVYRDDANRLADRLDARSTPEAFLFDRSGRLRYRGRIDDATNPARVRAHSLRDAIETVLSGGEVPETRTLAAGCAIHRVSLQ
jgi:peroxiredoxin